MTARDLGLLANLARLRLASGEQLAALDGGSVQNVSRSLLALWENEYVERLLGQIETRVLYKGSFPLIYGLTRPGAWLLRKHGYDVRGVCCTRPTSSKVCNLTTTTRSFMTIEKLKFRQESRQTLTKSV